VSRSEAEVVGAAELERARDIAGDELGLAVAELMKPASLSAVGRVTLRERLPEPAERVASGRIARSGVIWDGPAWAERELAGLSLAEAPAPAESYRDVKPIDRVPLAQRERARAMLDDWSQTSETREIEFDVRVERERVVELRGRGRRALVGIDSGRVLVVGETHSALRGALGGGVALLAAASLVASSMIVPWLPFALGTVGTLMLAAGAKRSDDPE